MILLITIALGLMARVMLGRSLAELAKVSLRGESLLMILLVLQALAPALSLRGQASDIAYWVWLGTFPILIAVVVLNAGQPGMVLLGLGLTLNFAVIVANQGMPVAPAAVTSIRPDLTSAAIPMSDFVHVSLTAASRLPWLADTIPVPGPAWIRSVVSAGDLLLFAGVFSAVACARIVDSTHGPMH